MIPGLDDDRILGGLIFNKEFPEEGIRNFDMAIAYEELVCRGVDADINTLPEYLRGPVQEAINEAEIDIDEGYYPGGLARLKKESIGFPGGDDAARYYAWDSENHEPISFWYGPVAIVVGAIADHYKVPAEAAVLIPSFEPDGMTFYCTAIWNGCYGEVMVDNPTAASMTLYLAKNNPELLDDMLDKTVIGNSDIWSAWITLSREHKQELLEAAESHGCGGLLRAVRKAAGKHDDTDNDK